MSTADERVRAIVARKNAEWAAQQKEKRDMVPILMGAAELTECLMKGETVLFEGELVRVESLRHEATDEHWRTYVFTLSNGREVIFRNESLEDEARRKGAVRCER
jgi:hypothetical protein